MRHLTRLGFVLVLAGALPFVASGQGRNRGFTDEGTFENAPYNGRFTFSRIRYGSGFGRGFGFGGAWWAHDYPRADQHLAKIVSDLTTVDANLDASNVFDLDDPEIFRHPIIYISEPGFWRITESEALNLRKHVLKGGFAIFDDFDGPQQWANMEAQVRVALPEYHFIELDASHPVFHSFFEVKDVHAPMMGIRPRFMALFEDNDPSKRMMMLANHDNDLGEFWEWSDSGMFPVDLTNEAYKFGVNYIVYAMTH
ncbi:MAG: DUF4159 domain-containing protein [Vicinamibacterales bacterium]